MPRSPILAVLDWKSVFDQCHDWTTWIEAAESQDQADRMKRALQRQEFEVEHVVRIGAVPRPVHVVAFAEDWCGDVIRHAPVLEKLARTNPKIRVRYCSREEQPEIFARFLTNGGEAVPKFVFLSEEFVECGNWGPMPHALREVISRGKACGDVAAARRIVSEGYKQDPGRHDVVEELLEQIDIASAERPA